jgi:hypothetical protein
MLVSVAGPELSRRDVAPDRPDDLGVDQYVSGF